MVRINFKSNYGASEFNPEDLNVDEHNAYVLSTLKPDEALIYDGKSGKLKAEKSKTHSLAVGKHFPKTVTDRFDLDSTICRALGTLAERVSIKKFEDFQDVDSIFEKISGRGLLQAPGEAHKYFHSILAPKLENIDFAVAPFTKKYLAVFKDIFRAEKCSPTMAMVKAANMMLYDPDVPSYYKDLIKPKLIDGGMSGVYFVKDILGNELGVFKPTLEGAYLRDNPKGLTPEKLKRLLKAEGFFPTKKGFTLDCGTKAEMFGYTISEALFPGFTPETGVVTLKFPQMQTDPKSKIILKEGSFQALAQGIMFGNLSPDELNTLPAMQFQMLGVLDIISGNNDRHAFNFFCDLKKQTISPIDHGLSVGEDLILSKDIPVPLSGLDMVGYLYSSQLTEPLEENVQEAILEFPLEEVIKKLKAQGATDNQIRGVELRYKALKLCITKGFNLQQAARMLSSFGKGNGLFGQIQLIMLYENANRLPTEKSILSGFNASDEPSLEEIKEQLEGVNKRSYVAERFLQENPQTLSDPIAFYNDLLKNFSNVLDCLDPKVYLVE